MTRVDTTRRRVVAMVTGWVVVVLVVGGLTFAVVSRAGSEVGQVSALRTAATDGPDDASTSGAPTSPGTTHATPTPTRSSDEPDDGTSSPPATAPTHSRTTPPGTSSPTRTTRPPSPPPPTRRTASFTTEGGTLVASCTGSAIRRESITVRYGWRVEEEVGRTRLSVHFKRTSGGDGDREGAAVASDGDGEVELTVACVQGVPTRTSH